jgi:uncharacterized protein (DUF2062 family)
MLFNPQYGGRFDLLTDEVRPAWCDASLESRWKAHLRGLFVVAVMIAALTGTIAFVLLVRVG